jgi:hypothetical protein
MSLLIKRYLPLSIVSTVILVVIFQYYLDFAILKDLSGNILNWTIIMATIAVGVGVINLLSRYAHNIIRRTEYWPFNLWTIIVLLAVTLTGLIYPFGSNSSFNWLISNVYLPGDSSIYAMVFFDVCYAFWRAFKVRNTDSALLLVAAFFIMMYNAPVTSYYLPQMASFGKWIFDNPSTAANRGIGLVTAIGTLAFAYRVIMQQEKGAIGIGESVQEG